MKSYDYTQEGAYFITVCTFDRLCLLGEVVDDAMQPSNYGDAVMETWNRLASHYPHVQTPSFVLMPNHIHGIIIVHDMEGESPGQRLSHNHRHGLTEVIRAFKSFSARDINRVRGTCGQPVWQRGFYDHVIRSEKSLIHICQYIENNPLEWTLEHDNPENLREGLKPSPTRQEQGRGSSA